MSLSARNRLAGTVRSIDSEGLVAEVVVETEGGETVAAVITRDSVERLGIDEDDEVSAVVKATDVMIEAE
ncbi:TOBE domain-containing protein [Halegenticoccus tardaugens]|uniref:TOBE domain-containing protein n=1 Tax=Halegenticoccus tardaugens TaxID=2071624 RepID=UPI00100B4A02|nr:TOBE domain-containing protein [Halegenticoccus tardaugens]